MLANLCVAYIMTSQNEEAEELMRRVEWCVRWWEAAERPEAELLAVMKHVRFAAMAEGFLQITVRAWPALDSKDGRDLLTTSLVPLQRPLPRWGLGPRLIYVVGGCNEHGRLSTVELHDPQNASWKWLAPMTSPRSLHGCVALDGKLYAVGGVGDVGQALATAEVYDPQTDGWQPLPKMSTARCQFGLAAAGGKIYAFGGWDGCALLTSVEAYDPQLGAWALVASMSSVSVCVYTHMSRKRRDHASVVLDGKIYTMGGMGAIVLDTVEVYDPQTNRWRRVASMPQGRYLHAAAVMGGKIYVTGGYSQKSSVNSVFVYDPQADAWTQLASMSYARRNHASTAAGGKLYVFGGYGVNLWLLNTAEVYDPASDTWALSCVQGSTLTSPHMGKVAVAL